MIALHPASFQTSDTTTTTGNHRGSVRNAIGLRPARFSRSLMSPSPGESSASRMPYMMTHERKCGRYEAVCTTLRSRRLVVSASDSARRMAVGMPTRSFARLYPSVLRISCPK